MNEFDHSNTPSTVIVIYVGSTQRYAVSSIIEGDCKYAEIFRYRADALDAYDHQCQTYSDAIHSNNLPA